MKSYKKGEERKQQKKKGRKKAGQIRPDRYMIQHNFRQDFPLSQQSCLQFFEYVEYRLKRDHALCTLASDITGII